MSTTMPPELAGPLDDLESSVGSLRSHVRGLVPDGDVDLDQAASNELAWAYARYHAAAATARWAAETGDRLAAQIALAAIQSAAASVRGRSAVEAVDNSRLLDRITSTYRPLEDLGASEEQRLVRATFRDFAAREVRPRAADIHRGNLDVPEEIISGLRELGTFGLSVPAEYGGAHGDRPDFETMLIVTEELSRASLGAGGSLVTRPEILVRAILRGGTAQQQTRWLPAIASGERMVAVATTEPDYGSDVAGIRCRASRVDGGWLVNGTKLWCTFAGRAEILMLLLRTGDQGHRGVSVFVVEKPAFPGHDFVHRQPDGGVLAGRSIPTIGYRGMHTYELSFADYKLPYDALLGGEEWLNRGFYLQMDGFSIGRLQTAGRAVGVMQAALEDALRFTSERVVFRRPVIEYGLPRVMLGRMITQVASARQLTYDAARRLEAGDGQMEASLAKLYASRVAEEVTRDAVQLHGGMGYAEETDVSRYFVDARVFSIFEGAEEILALRVIARALLAAE